jgi:site-specific recombinase XerD
MSDMNGIDADGIAFENLNYDTLTEFFNWMGKERNCSQSTKKQRLAAISSFAAYAQNRDFEAAYIFRNSVNKISFKKALNTKRSVFSRDEVSILLSLPDGNRKIGYRDLVLLSVMYASGARAQEVCDLTVGNVLHDQEKTWLIIKGKGGKTRRVGIPHACSVLLKEYVKHRKIGYFPNRHIFSSQTREHMTVSCVEEIFKKYISTAKEQNRTLFLEDRYTPHSMRHATATHMLNAGVPLVVLKNFLGHESLQSTMIYAQISQSTVDKHIKDWNEKWFTKSSGVESVSEPVNRTVDFLR